MFDVEMESGQDGVWRQKSFQPGVYGDIANEEYHASDGVSKSHTDDIAPELGHTPLHYWDKRINPNQDPPKEREDWALLGDAAHKAILQPDLMSQFAFVPDDAPARPTDAMRKSKNPSLNSQERVSWWEDFERENAGKMILPAKMHRAIQGARDAVHMHPVAKTLFQGGQAEQTYYAIDPETGALVKCRLDYDLVAKQGRIVDLKTTEDAAPRAFKRSMRTYRYDVQDAWYRDTVDLVRGAGAVRQFIFVAVEKVRPFAINITWIEPEDVLRGRELGRRDLRTILECRRTGLWPDWGCSPSATRIDRRNIDQ